MVVQRAFPTWGSMAPHIQPEDEQASGADAFRINLQKKTFRTTKFLESDLRKLNCVLLSFIGIPLEHLMLRLDWVDHRGRGLFDLSILDQNPFKVLLILD